MIAYFDCFSGASGDMLLGSLLDAGLSLVDLQADLARLGVGGYRLGVKQVTRRGLTGTQFSVAIETGDYPARTLPAVEGIVGASELPPRVRARSLAVFRRMAGAEARVHGVPIEEIHFHEIGAVDSLVDVVGFCAALERMEIETVCCSPLPLGGGTIQTEHGLLPVPAPATLALLVEAGAPTVPGPGEGELVTPTGAALLTELASFERPAMTIQSAGYGFGAKEFAWPNALRVWLGRPLAAAAAMDSDQVVEMACNLDNVTGETLGYVMEHLLAAGALDVWFTPIQMKKNRPAVELSLLAPNEALTRLAAIVLRETPTLGVRYRTAERYKAEREIRSVDTPWGSVRVKVKILQGQVVSASPEYDDCARLAAQVGLPLADVTEAARQALAGK